jgi:prepilin-type N-terminal cleavage/methylation domain-containing protein
MAPRPRTPFTTPSRAKPVRDLRAQDGFTLIELLVVSAMLTVVVAAVLGLYQVAVKEQTRVEANTTGLAAERNGLERMTRELRQANSVCTVSPTCDTTFSNASSIEFQRCQSGAVTTGCTQLWVRYNCSGTPAQSVPPNTTTRACLRSQASTAAGLGSSQQILIPNVKTTPTGIFSFTAPAYVTMSVQVSAKGYNKPIILQDGVRIRNVNENAGTVGN